ncbi:hypothetical protein HDV06_000223 [Boothiomyces sp. JEL0866]|nr:hypothetical protein HDV06_000223 [Boothiomyces sp. JEL0866]
MNGLGYSSMLDVEELVQQPDGLDCWLAHSNSNSQSCDNLFKVFYKLIGNTTGKLLVQYTSCCLKYYLQTENCNPEVVDKILHQFTHKISNKEVEHKELLEHSYSVLISPLKFAQFKTARLSILGWLKNAVDLVANYNFDFLPIAAFISTVTKCEAVRQLTSSLQELIVDPTKNLPDTQYVDAKTILEFSKFEAQLTNLLTSCIQKQIQPRVDACFHSYLQTKAKLQTTYLNYQLFLDWFMNLVKYSNLASFIELETVICNVYLLNAQLVTALDQDYQQVQELIISAHKKYPKSMYLTRRLESLAYNISVHLMNSKDLNNTIWFIEFSLELSKSLPKDEIALIPRKMMHLQYLNAAGRPLDCIRIAKEILASSQLDHKTMETLVTIYTIASFKTSNTEAAFLFEFQRNNPEKLLQIIELEYKTIFLYGRKFSNDSIQEKFLEKVTLLQDLIPQSYLIKYALKSLQLSRKLEKSDTNDKAQTLIQYISNLDQNDRIIASYKAISYCESALCKAEGNEFDTKDLEAAFKTWSDLLVNIPVVKIFSPSYESPISDLEELQDYLEALNLYVSLSLAYIDLGYSGKAGLALTTAKTFLENADSQSKNMFHLTYCLYLNTIGNSDKCMEYRSKTEILDGEIEALDQFLPKLIDFHLAFSSGDSLKAYHLALKGYRDISKYLKKSDGDLKTISRTATNNLEYTFDSLLNINTILIHQGLPTAAEYYLKLGISLAEKFHSNYYFVTFSLLLSDLNRMQDRLEASLGLINSAKEAQFKISDLAVLEATLWMVKGDINVKFKISNCGNPDIEYKEGIARLETIIDPQSSLLPSEVDEKELVRYFREDSAKKRDLSIFTDLFKKYVTLESLKAKILCKAAEYLSEEGKIKEAAANLQDASLLSILKGDKSYYNYSVSKLKMNQFLQKLLKINFMEMFSESVLCLPWILASSNGRDTKSANKKIVDQLENSLKDALCSSWEFGNSDDAFQIAHSMILLQMIKGYVVQYKFDVNQMCDYLLLLLEIPRSLYYSRQKKAGTPGITYSPTNLSAFQKDFFECIPNGLLICTLSVDPLKKNLIVSRATNKSRILFKLPLTRFATREGGINGEGFDYHAASEELNSIMELNKSSTQNAKNCKSSKDRNNWFQSRKELDLKLKELLKKIDQIWFGGFKGLISPVCIPEHMYPNLAKFQQSLTKLIFKSVSKFLPKGAVCQEFDVELCEIIVTLGTDTLFEELEDVVYFLLDCYQSKGHIIDYDEVNVEDLRDDMLELISQFYIETNFKRDERIHDAHIVLIPDKNTQYFPWESLPTLRGKPVSRLPSYLLAKERFSLPNQLDIRNTVYVLNPSGDLKKTQNTFANLLESRRNWKGYTGSQPNVTQLKSDLENSNLYLYFGHGAGESVITRNDLESLQKIPVSLIFGCSSGQLKWKGQFDPVGMATEFLSLGCPLVVGNLWDITDVDIDRFTLDLLTRWGVFPGSKRNYSICEATAAARSACNLPYIVGASPVIYGLPLYIAK